MKMRKLKWLGVLVIGLVGCYDYSRFDNISIEPFSPSLVFPLINDTLSLREILEQSDSISLIQENADHSYSLLFRDTIDAGFAADQFSIPDQVFPRTFTAPSVLPTPSLPAGDYGPFSTEYNEVVQTTTEAGGTVELKRVDFSSGTLQIRLINNFHNQVKIDLTITSLKNSSNNPLVINNINLATFGSQYNNSINLVNYYFDCYHPTLDIYNDFNFTVSATVTSTGGPVNAGDNVDIRISVVNPAFSRITGKINYNFDQANQSFNVDLFQATSSVQQHFADPKFRLGFVNSYGVPMSVTFPQFQLSNRDNVTYSIANTRANASDLQVNTSTPNVITRITSVGQQPATTNFVLSKDNSDIVSAFDIAPTRLNFGSSFKVGDNTTNHDYFVDQSSTIKLNTEVEIPIYGWASISLTDTLENNLTDLDSIDNIDINDATITLTLKISNQIPFGIYLQASFVDDAYVEKAKLFDGVADQQLITSPNVGTDGISNSTAYKKTNITITKAKYEQMTKATKMILRYRFALGAVNQNVKILSTNKMGIQAGISISATLKPKF